MEKPRKRLNKKRLIIELSIITAVVLGIILWCFLPWFFAQPLPNSDSYAEYKLLYNDVMSYDFSKGPSENLEKRLDRAIENYISTNQYYFNLKARAEYNYHLGNTEKATEDFKEAKDYAPTEEEEIYIYNRYHELIGDKNS